MLDLAFGLEKTSRLGCQIVMTEGAGRAGGEAAGGQPQPAEQGEPAAADRIAECPAEGSLMRILVAMSGGVDSSVGGRAAARGRP